MTATITTLPNEFPLVFVCRVAISVALLAFMIYMAYVLYKKQKINKLQKNCMIVLSVYVVLMLYYTVIGRYSQSYYRYDGEIFGTFHSLFSNFNMAEFIQLAINLLMMVPVSFMLMHILNCRHKALWAFDLTALLILAIELLQFFTKSGTFQFDDILCNIFGAVAGILFYYLFKLIFKQKRNDNI